MYIIGINGFKRSGKGETANAIEAQVLIGGVKQVGFADKVKILCARALGFLDLSDEKCIELMDLAKEHWLIGMATEAHDEMPPFNMGGLTGRAYLQNVGTEARKIFGADFWVDQVLPKPESLVLDYSLKTMHPHVDWLLITDLRFENEAQRVLDLGGEVWNVTRPGTGSDGHASEQELPPELITRYLNNCGTLDDLADLVTVGLDLIENGIR